MPTGHPYDYRFLIMDTNNDTKITKFLNEIFTITDDDLRDYNGACLEEHTMNYIAEQIEKDPALRERAERIDREQMEEAEALLREADFAHLLSQAAAKVGEARAEVLKILGEGFHTLFGKKRSFSLPAAAHASGFGAAQDTVFVETSDPDKAAVQIVGSALFEEYAIKSSPNDLDSNRYELSLARPVEKGSHGVLTCAIARFADEKVQAWDVFETTVMDDRFIIALPRFETGCTYRIVLTWPTTVN